MHESTNPKLSCEIVRILLANYPANFCGFWTVVTCDFWHFSTGQADCERMNFNPDYESIATAFVQHYYSKFDQGDGIARAQGLGDLYDPENSYMSFEGVQCKGRDSILAKFSSLTFKQIQRAITKCDSQPLYDGSILVMVLGQLKTDDDPINPFSQIFILRPNTTGSFFIANEIFRLDLHNN
ncbi:unnamed protein product [Cylicocyclus nassatus]|uniref:NTF2 domain-containing protein n=1 Tax=Cylicocyclus nassatus TaxID=53992 RepID=A0AA36DTR8_CYLNA|nr:unnamed protein product [Cylicocyclus nassatus]